MKSTTYHDILDQAIQAEIEAARFYQDVSQKTADDFLKDLFLGLSQEEKRHRQILETFRNNASLEIHFANVSDFKVSETVEMPELSIEMKPAEAIALAMKKEEAAMQQYRQMADSCNDDAQKKVFLELAAMERGHKAKMEKAFVDIGYPEVW